MERSTVRDRYARAEASQEDKFNDQFDVAYVHEKFVLRKAEKWLLDRLGKAITKRRAFLRYARDHRERMTQEVVPDKSHPPQNVQVSQDVDGPARSVVKTQDAAHSLPQTKATTLTNVDHNFIDDGFDDTQSVYTKATTVSDGRSPDRLRVVRLRDIATLGEPFVCPYCHTMQKYNGQRAWK